MTSAPAAALASVRVFVVDDHPFFREGLLAWISWQKNFVCCGQAESPAQAIRGITECKPDIILLDLRLRDGDGLEVLRALSARKSSPPAIILTSSGDTAAAEKALRAGARAYILKNEVADVLLLAIETVLKGGIHVSGSIHAPKFDAASVVTPSPGQLRNLGHREHQVLRLLGRGFSTIEIANDLILSPKTVEFHCETLKKKLDVSDSLALVRLATLWEHQGRLGYWRQNPGP